MPSCVAKSPAALSSLKHVVLSTQQHQSPEFCCWPRHVQDSMGRSVRRDSGDIARLSTKKKSLNHNNSTVELADGEKL